MMELIDLRTLALTNILLGIFLGTGTFVFARIHPSFRGFKSLGYSYFAFSLGFILIALRQFIPDLLSVIVANVFIIGGFSLLIISILKFLKYESKTFEKVAILLACTVLFSFVYFTLIQENLNARMIIVSAMYTGLSLYIGYKVLINKHKVILTFTRFLGFSFIYCSLVFILRIFYTIQGPVLTDFMNASIIHSFSLIAMQFMFLTSCFTLTISACQQLASKLAIQATVDPLTNIYNRRAFDDLGQKRVLHAQRSQTPISIIIMDIDLFKNVNDNFGHQAGDSVLKEFTLRLQNSLREYDMLARYGGEEFVLLLPDTNNSTAMIIAEKLRVKIASPVFCLEKTVELNVTASFGVATIKGSQIDWQQLISFADTALYQAKESGRNRVKLHSAEVHQLQKVDSNH